MKGAPSTTPPARSASRPSWSGADRGPGLTKRIAAWMLLVDVGFKSLAGAATVNLLIISDADAAVSYRLLALLVLPTIAGWLFALVLLLRPVERWARAGAEASDNQIMSAAFAAHRTPHRFALMVGLTWLLAFGPLVPLLHSGSLAAVALPAEAGTAVAFQCGAFVFGSYALCSALMARLLGPIADEISIAARDRGLTVASGGLSIHRRLVVMAICLSIAPTCWMASIAYVTHGRVISLESEYRALAGAAPSITASSHFGMTLVLYLAPVVLFALLSSWFLARDVAGAINKVGAVIQTVGRHERGGSVARIPVFQHDEVGALAHGANQMIDRLEAEARERTRAERALRELNNDLERRVTERTALLVKAHEALIEEARVRELAEVELRQAQKLEAVGRLAAGIAHEINTPIQFVGDSIYFFRESLAAFSALLEKYGELRRAAEASELHDHARALIRAEEEADLDYLKENLPKALDSTIEGLERVSSIIRSMKEFAHPDSKEKIAVDINRAVESTLTIARNEFKYVADLETDFQPLPPVSCFLGEVNQAVLNVIVNAAHAIAAKVEGTDQRGRLTVRTRAEPDAVVVSVGDTGGGIPDAIRDRVFEPFFTTKDVGRGTGQGLHIARRVIVEQHGGAIWFDSTPGEGTTFFIRLPRGHLPSTSAEPGSSGTLPKAPSPAA